MQNHILKAWGTIDESSFLLRFLLLLRFLFCLEIFLKYMDLTNMSDPRSLNLTVSQVQSHVGLTCLSSQAIWTWRTAKSI